jgi:hypothetical protein
MPNNSDVSVSSLQDVLGVASGNKFSFGIRYDVASGTPNWFGSLIERVQVSRIRDHLNIVLSLLRDFPYIFSDTMPEFRWLF